MIINDPGVLLAATTAAERTWKAVRPDGTCGECAGTGVLDCACPYRCHIHH